MSIFDANKIAQLLYLVIKWLLLHTQSTDRLSNEMGTQLGQWTPHNRGLTQHMSFSVGKKDLPNQCFALLAACIQKIMSIV